MADPTVLYCVGAAKAGTSWFFRALADHPDCALRSVKEAHYWDTFDTDVRRRQAQAFRRRLDGFVEARAKAEAGEIGWQVANMNRQIADMTALVAVIDGDRTDDAAYIGWLTAGSEGHLVADMTPNYATLTEETLSHMAALSPLAKFVFLIRDPLSRLWSHVRMQAERQRQAHEAFDQKANAILWRILNRGQETHILERGDYPGIAARLRRAIPAQRLRIEYCERLFTETGLREMCAFLGIRFVGTGQARRVHEGPKAVMRADLAPAAVTFLKDHYDWAARDMGPLPREWQDNLARIAA